MKIRESFVSNSSSSSFCIIGYATDQTDYYEEHTAPLKFFHKEDYGLDKSVIGTALGEWSDYEMDTEVIELETLEAQIANIKEIMSKNEQNQKIKLIFGTRHC